MNSAGEEKIMVVLSFSCSEIGAVNLREREREREREKTTELFSWWADEKRPSLP